MTRRPILYLVRHGETDWNAEGRLQGQQDIPLNALGRAQAEQAARRLRSVAPHVASLDFLASPMGRTRETMEILRRTLGLDPAAYAMDERLKEITFGTWEGLTWREVRQREPEAAAARNRDKWNYTPPEGESYAALLRRVLPFVDSLTRESVIVSHGGIARVLLAGLCGVATEEAPRTDIWQGRVLVIQEGRFTWI